jgi:hypothetical protein
MTDPQRSFHESTHLTTPIRELNLRIEGSPLEPILEEFLGEVRAVAITRVSPRFYLSTEWGVPDGTIAIAIPFYLVSPELTQLQADRQGYVEGTGKADILRYLRHEMGHVINYAYRLHEAGEWSDRFGEMDEPYLDDYRPEPFSRRHVVHLPGWYAQKHPDEDWAETFAVWMTPGLDWRTTYADWPVALEKLHYCDFTMAWLADREPVVTADGLDVDVAEIDYSVEDHYQRTQAAELGPFPDLDGVLRSILEDRDRPNHSPADAPRGSASALIRKLELDLVANVYRWTGSFPERTRPLIHHLAERAEQLEQVYPIDSEAGVVVALTSLITALATNQVRIGTDLG